MSDTLIAVATPVDCAFTATAGDLPVIFVANGQTLTQALTIDPLQIGVLSPSTVLVASHLSPDGRLIAYTLSDNGWGSPVLRIADLAAATSTTIIATEGEERVSDILWRSDASGLAYIKSQPNSDNLLNREIYTIQVDGSNPTKVYAGGDAEMLLGFSSDGQKIYLMRRSADGSGLANRYGILTLADGTVQDVALDMNTDVAGPLTPLNMQLMYQNGQPRLIYTLSDSLYLQANHPTPIKIADAETGEGLVLINVDQAVTNLLATDDGVKAVYTIRQYDTKDDGTSDIKGSALQVVNLDDRSTPTTVLPLQDDVSDYSGVIWTGDKNGVIITNSKGTVELLKLDGSLTTLINQSSVGELVDKGGGGVRAFSAGPGVEVVIKAPYVHQLRNTADNFNGESACGPTSCVMAVAAYGKLDARNDFYGKEVTQYGYYVSNAYFSNGTNFNRTHPDDNGRAAAGGYGWCVDWYQGGHAAYGGKMADYLSKHGLRARLVGGANQEDIKARLRSNKLVVLSTTIQGFGHIVLLKGLTTDGRYIVNDPYWRKPGAGDDIYAWYQFGSTPFMVVIDDAVPGDGGGGQPAGGQPTGGGQQPPAQDVPPIIGQDLPVDKQQRFVAAYKRAGGRAALGTSGAKPVQVNPPANPRWVQDLSGGSLGQALIALDDRFDQPTATPVPSLQPAFVIRQPILKMYRDIYQGSGGPLGSIMSDQFTNMDGKQQVNFQAGWITWDGQAAEASDAFAWPTAFNGWKAEYFNNPTLAGAPSFIRDEPNIDYEWGGGAPEGGKIGIFPDHYSVRWSRTLTFEEGQYLFSVTADDGFRLYLDGQSLVPGDANQFWSISAPLKRDFNASVTAGQHTVIFEYFEWEGGATAKFEWTKVG